MKKISLIIICVFAAILVSCTGGNGNSGKDVLTVSIDPQKKILESIVGDRFDVNVLLPGNSNPESYEPSMSQRMAVSDSKAFFLTGYLPFERTVADAAGDALVVDTSRGIEVVTGTHSHGDGQHLEADPHVWASLRNGKAIAANMLEAVKKIDPENAGVYQANYDRLVARLDSLDNVVGTRLSDAGVHAFAVWHPSLSYFARDYGLHQIAVGQESKEVSVNTMRGIIDEARDDGVKVFFFQKEYDSRQAESINKAIGSRLETISPMSYDWDGELVRITDILTK